MWKTAPEFYFPCQSSFQLPLFDAVSLADFPFVFNIFGFALLRSSKCTISSLPTMKFIQIALWIKNITFLITINLQATSIRSLMQCSVTPIIRIIQITFTLDERLYCCSVSWMNGCVINCVQYDITLLIRIPFMLAQNSAVSPLRFSKSIIAPPSPRRALTMDVCPTNKQQDIVHVSLEVAEFFYSKLPFVAAQINEVSPFLSS